jgi:hypothetical protein
MYTHALEEGGVLDAPMLQSLSSVADAVAEDGSGWGWRRGGAK